MAIKNKKVWIGLLFTALFLFIYRLGYFIQIPFVSIDAVKTLFSSVSLFLITSSERMPPPTSIKRPSIFAASRSASGTPTSINCFIRKQPTADGIAGKIYTQYVSIIPNFEKIKYCGTPSVTVLYNIIIWTIVNNTFFSLIFDFEKVNAAKEIAIIEKNVETIVINNVLNTYLEIGICKLLNKSGNAKKFANVGRDTKNFGGKINNSSKGFKDVIIQ